jgi:endoglucanase
MYGGLSAPQAREMVRAYRLTGDEKYLRGSILSAQFGAGANPLNMTFTTGVGLRFPERVLHVDSEVTGQKVPIGITVCGPVDLSHESEAHWQKPVDPFIYPAVSAWPTVESFWNTRWFAPMTEYTVQHPMAENALVWGYLAVRKKK